MKSKIVIKWRIYRFGNNIYDSLWVLRRLQILFTCFQLYEHITSNYGMTILFISNRNNTTLCKLRFVEYQLTQQVVLK